jgi:hypothetical protein
MLCVFTVEKKCSLHIVILLVYIVSFFIDESVLYFSPLQICARTGRKEISQER